MASPVPPPTANAVVVAPYGSWPSPVSTDLLTADTAVLGGPFLTTAAVFWTEARPSDGGRISLYRQDRQDGATPVELTPEHYLRSRVHEYGGGAWAVADATPGDPEVVVFSHFPTDVVFRLDATGCTPITAPDTLLRYGDLRVHPERDLVLAVREDHRSGGEPTNTLVALTLSGPNTDGGRVLCAGADFYTGPELSADGRLAWVEWDHPNMPWDDTRLMVARLDPAQTLVDVTTVVRGPEAPTAPSWDGDRLVFCTDRSGFWNLYAYGRDGVITRLSTDDHDQAGPAWMLGGPSRVVRADGTIIVPRYRDGRMELVQVGADGQSSPLGRDVAGVAGLSTDGTQIAVLEGYPDRPSAIVIMDPATPQTAQVVVSASRAALERDLVSRPESITWDGPQGEVQAWYYPPHQPGYVGEPGTAPPVITLSHGGPTGVSLPTFDLAKQYWTSRGFAVVDVNYGGSAGFGRAYRQRLAGQWGEVDVADCVDATATLVARGLADPSRLVIMGGSAGGYTTLRALTATDVFSLGISLFGIGDLGAMATDTHKFESRYLDGLIGPWPQARALYDQRSPVNHLDQLTCPMLLLQGTDDKVVPPAQAEQMAAAVQANGLDCELIVFPGEGHGFRRAENIQRTYAASLEFCQRVFGL